VTATDQDRRATGELHLSHDEQLSNLAVNWHNARMPDSRHADPQRNNEHTDQHLVAGYADAVYTADDQLWRDEPGVQRQLPKQARQLGHQLDFPKVRWQTGDPKGYVWHCSLSIPAPDGQLTDEQWTEAAHEVVKALGFDGGDGKAPCRWIAVRHGLSANGNDHIHIAVNLVREDGTKASTWNDYRKVGRACSELEDRFGLTKVHGRMTGRSLPEPSRADTEISAKHRATEPLRTRLERKVRACAAVATSEAHFTQIARQNGLLIRPRYTPDGTTVTGYAFADAAARRTQTGGPIWFGGGKLAPDLSVTKLRARWSAPANPLTRTADALAAVAVTAEPNSPGNLSAAARHMARAAQEPALATVITTMADTFTAVVTADPLQLAREIDALITDCLIAARTAHAKTEITSARTLLHTTAETLAAQAEREALHRGTTMTELTHEDELLTHLTQAGMLSARLARALLSPAGTSALKAAGYNETTPYDDHLRALLGEDRWAKYVADPGRIKTAAAITGAARAGHEVPALLARAVNRRAWEDDAVSPSRSIAHVLAYRIARELAAPAARRTPASAPAASPSRDTITTDGSPTGHPEPATPFDGTLRDLLGVDRWRQYAEDPRRPQVAELLTEAAAAGRDVPVLLEQAVTRREFEDDPVSPARRVAAVLHYRLKAAMADSGNNQQKNHAQDHRPRTAARTRNHDGRETR
jgi:hypothetical protein